MNEQLTDEQVQNWRMILCEMIGPYALIMPRAQVQELRDKMQMTVNKADTQSFIEVKETK